MPCAAPVMVNYFHQKGDLGFDKFIVTSKLVIIIESLCPPEGSIRGVVLWCLSTIGKVVGEHAFAHVFAESFQNAASIIRPVGGEAESAQANHRIATPIRKPGITGNDSLAIG